MGTKLIFIPYVVIISFYSWYFLHKKKYTKQYLALVALCFALFSFSVFSTTRLQGDRLSAEISRPTSSAITQLVDYERKTSIKTLLTNMFSNKLVVWIKDSTSKYLRVFSTNFLFVSGEERSTFSLWYHGYFYYLDFFFLLLGFYALFKKKKSFGFLVLSLIAIAPLPTVASDVQSGFAALRSALLFPFRTFAYMAK